MKRFIRVYGSGSGSVRHPVLNTINSLNVRKSRGFNHIPRFFAKPAGPVISEPFFVLVNHSITLGIFPEVLKVAKVIPVYKSGSRLNQLITLQFHCCHVLPKFLKNCYIKDSIFLYVCTQ